MSTTRKGSVSIFSFRYFRKGGTPDRHQFGSSTATKRTISGVETAMELHFTSAELKEFGAQIIYAVQQVDFYREESEDSEPFDVAGLEVFIRSYGGRSPVDLWICQGVAKVVLRFVGRESLETLAKGAIGAAIDCDCLASPPGDEAPP